jgi:hypothetical protein
MICLKSIKISQLVLPHKQQQNLKQITYITDKKEEKVTCKNMENEENLLTMQYSKQPFVYFPLDKLSCSSTATNLQMFISFARAMSAFVIWKQ